MRADRMEFDVIRWIVRFAALLLLAGAFAASVIDGARSIAADQLSLTSVGAALYWAFPTKFPLAQAFVEKRLHPLLWDPVLVRILLAPAFLFLALLGGVLLYLARRRAPPIGHSNRDR